MTPARFTRISTYLLLPLLLCSCGGGSGGGSTPSKASSSQLTSSSSSSEISSSASSSVNLAPEFTLLFPNQNAKTNSGVITVRGVAKDDKGISSVTVNGVTATLKSSSEQQKSQQKKLMKGEASTAPLEVEWEATLDLPVGDIPIKVEVTDTDQTTVDNSGNEIILRNLRMPIYWLNDTTHNRWIGSGSEYFYDKIAIDKTTKEITELPHRLEINGAEELSADGTTLYSSQISPSAIGNGGSVGIDSTDIATGNKTRLFNIDLEDVAPKTYWGAIYETTFDTKSNDYYLLIDKKTPDVSERFESAILRVNVLTGEHSIITNTEKSGLSFLGINDLLFSSEALYVLADHSTVYSVDLTSGNLTKIIDGLDIYATHIAVDDEKKYLYAVGLRNIAKVLLSDGSVELISEDVAQTPLNLAQIKKVQFYNNQLLIGDSSVSSIIAVNTETGERSEYLSFGIGEGLGMIVPRQIAVNKTKTTAYILDDGDNAPERLISLDLATGNRTLLYTFQYQQFSNALILDEENGRLFIAFEKTFGVFDLAEQDYEELLSYVWPDETYVQDLIYDSSANRLLFNPGPSLISSFDLATKTVSTAYQTNEGEDVTISGTFAMALDTKRNQLLIKSYLEGKLFSLDLASGKRTLILEKCLDERNFDHLSRDTHTEMEYDASTDSVIFNGEFKLLKIAIETAQCSYTPSASFVPLDIWPMTADTALEISFNSVFLVDFKTGQNITIAR